MEGRRILLLLSVCIMALGFASACATGGAPASSQPGQRVAAVSCGEPVAAPKYEVGDKWTWRDEKGREMTDEVIGVEGDMTQIRSNSGDVAHYDKDRVIRKVVRNNGEVLLKQGAGAYVTIGQKLLDFPLEIGKEWEFSWLATPAGGGTGLQTYTSRYRVLACEEVTTPAGKFPALKIEIEQTNNVSHASGRLHAWYAPSAKSRIRSQYVPSRYWFNALDNELIKYQAK